MVNGVLNEVNGVQNVVNGVLNEVNGVQNEVYGVTKPSLRGTWQSDDCKEYCNE